MQYINDNDKELIENNYPISILLNDRKDIILLNSTTPIIFSTPTMKWLVNTNDLLMIMQNQNLVKPYNVTTEQ